MLYSSFGWVVLKRSTLSAKIGLFGPTNTLPATLLPAGLAAKPGLSVSLKSEVRAASFGKAAFQTSVCQGKAKSSVHRGHQSKAAAPGPQGYYGRCAFYVL